MKIQTYRIIEFEGEIKPGVDIPIVFEFKIFGSKGILKPPYQILIHINEFTGKVVYSECDCIDCSMRRNENCKRFAGKDYKCKHIKQGEEELIEDKHLTESEKTYVDMGGFSVDTQGNVDTVLPKTESIKIASKGCGGCFFGDDRLEYICGDVLIKEEGIRLCDSCAVQKANEEEEHEQ